MDRAPARLRQRTLPGVRVPGSTDGGAPRLAIRLLAQRARGALVEAGAFVRSRSISLRFDNRPGRKWHLFCDQPIDSTETCAISCAVIALVAVGDQPDSPLLDEALQTMLMLQLPSGGWTSWVTDLDNLTAEDPEEPLVIDTYFALSALRALGLEDSEPFLRGTEWFRKAQDAALGGWGFFPGGDPHVLPTSMALIALSAQGRQTEPLLRDVVNNGVEWLLARRGTGDDAGWANRANQRGSAVHTAWALRALSAVGYDPYSPPVVAAREWLLDNTTDRDSIIDHYITPGRTTIGRKRASRAITHLNFPEGIIVNGLLCAGANLLDPRLLTAVDQLIVAQEREGYWRCLHAPREQPVYALMDACAALRLFVDTVARHESVLEVSERVQQQEATVAALGERVEALRANSTTTVETAAALVTRLDELQARLDEQERRWEELAGDVRATQARLSTLNLGLTALRPAMWLTRLIVRWPVLTLLVVLSLLAYGMAAFTVPEEFRVISWITGGLLTVVTAITFWAQTRDPHPPPHVFDPPATKDAHHGS